MKHVYGIRVHFGNTYQYYIVVAVITALISTSNCLYSTYVSNGKQHAS